MLKLGVGGLEGEALAGAIHLINDLLLVGIDVRRVVTPRGARGLSAGDFLIDERLPSTRDYVKNVATGLGLKILRSSVSDAESHPRIRTPIVGIYCGAGVSPSYLVGLVNVLDKMGFSLLSFANSDTLPGSLENIDALILAGGDSTEIVLSVGTQNAHSIRTFVEKGGSFVGICAGAFVGMSQKFKSFGPNDDDFKKVQDEIGIIEGEVLNDLTEMPPVPIWSFKKFGDVHRIYPYQGPFRFKVKATRHPISLGLPKTVTLWMEGPVIRLRDPEAKSVIEFDSAIDGSAFGMKKDLVKRMFRSFSAVVAKKVGKGNYVISCPHIDSSTCPDGWLVLANSLFWATIDSPLILSPPVSTPLSAKQSALFAASIIDQSEEMNRSLQRLRRSLMNLLPLVMNSVSLRLGQDLADISNSVPELSKICMRISENMVSILHEEIKLDRLRESLTRGPIALPRDSQDLDHLATSLSKMVAEKAQMLATAGRAMPALAMISLRLEKNSAELFTKMTKGEPREFYEQIAVLIREIVGDKYFYVPWYDGKSGIIEAEGRDKDEGIIPPLLGIYVKTQRLRQLSESIRSLAVS